MAKIDKNDVKNTLLFSHEAFGLADASALDVFIDAVITDVSAMLAGVLGSVYNSVTEPAASQVKRAELCLTVAELLERRINKLLSNVTGAGEELDTRNEQNQLDHYETEAISLVSILLGDIDFSFGISNSTHFVDEAT